MSTGNAKRCEATKRDGSPCGGFAVTGSCFCFAHDPASREKRREARARGGAARHGRTFAPGERVTVRDVGDVMAVLEEAVNLVMGLEPSIAKARTLGYLAGVVFKGLELSEFDRRLSALEARQK